MAGDQLCSSSGHLVSLAAGDRVLIAAKASSSMVVAHCAALRAGLVVVPFNPSATPRELEEVIAQARPKMFVCGPPAVAHHATKIEPDLLVITPQVALSDGPVPELDAMAPGDPAMLVYTSGTTGTPKGAELSHLNLLAGAASVALAWEWSHDDVLALALPLCHVHGLCIGLHGTLLSGGSVVLFERFDPEAVLASAGGGTTMFFGVPTMYRRLVDAQGPSRLSAMRLCVSRPPSLPPSTPRWPRGAPRCCWSATGPPKRSSRSRNPSTASAVRAP